MTSVLMSELLRVASEAPSWMARQRSVAIAAPLVICCWRDSRRDLVSLLVPFHSKYIVNDLDGLFVFAGGVLER
jgi:hypothetical protein